MSWSIALLVNTVQISDACAKELFETANEDEIWYSADDVTDSKGVLDFNPDHMEHMDYLSHNDDVVRILKEHRVKGDICFGSLEGDDAGTFWGYRFDGVGGMKELEGTLSWTEDTKILKGKKVVITGTLKTMTRDEAERAIIATGGHLSPGVSKKTSFLVAGVKPGSKLRKAESLGVEILDEQQFIDLFQK